MKPSTIPETAGIVAEAANWRWRVAGGTAAGLVGLCCIVAVLAAILIGVVFLRYRAVEQSGEQMVDKLVAERVDGLTGLLREDVSDAFRQVDAVHAIARRVVADAQGLGKPDAEQQLPGYVDTTTSTDRQDIAGAMAIAADGAVLWSTPPGGNPTVDPRQRLWFRALADDPTRESYLGPPELNPASGEWTIPSSRALRDRHGVLRAVTVVSLRADLLARLTSDFNFAQDDAAALVGDDGTILMRSNMRFLGQSLPALAVGSRLADGDGTGHFKTSLLDGTRRYVVSRAIPGLPMRVALGVAESTQVADLAPMRMALLRGSAFLVAAILVMAVGTGVVLVLLRRSEMQRLRTAELAESEAWYRAVFDEMADAVLVHVADADGVYRVEYANRRAGELLGRPPGELIGLRHEDYIHPDDHAVLADRRARLRRGEVLPPFVYLVQRPDGAFRLITASKSFLQAGDRRSLSRQIATFQDVTAERMREAELAAARAQIDDMLEVMPGVFYRAAVRPGDPFQTTFVSPSIVDVLGIDPEIARQPGFFSSVTGLDMTELRRQALAKAAPASIATLEYPLHWQGRAFWLSDTFREITSDDGAREYVGMLSDTSALHAAEQNLRGAVELGPGVMYRARVDAVRVDVLEVHGEARRIADRYKDGEPCDPAMLGERLSQPEIAARMRQASDDTPITIGYSVTTDGRTRWLRNALRAVARTDAYVEVVGYIVDVTQAKQEILRMQQITTLLTLGKMATSMAHELNQPLASISFAAQNAAFLLQRQPADLQALKLKVDKINSEANRAAKLVEHMRIFGRNERKVPLAVTWQSVLAGAREILGVRLRGCLLEDALPANLPPVMGEAIPMEQVLINLIGNALDAYEDTPASVREVTVSGAVEGGDIVLRVSDRAGGIPDDAIARVFEPFFTTKRAGKGTGLGLALCFGTITEMGGTIDVRNDDGGAVFEIRVPAAPVPAAMRQSETTPA